MVKPELTEVGGGGRLERSPIKTLREDMGSEGSRVSRKGSSEVVLKEPGRG